MLNNGEHRINDIKGLILFHKHHAIESIKKRDFDTANYHSVLFSKYEKELENGTSKN